MSIFGGNTHAPKAVLDAARSIMRGEKVEEMSSKEKMKRGLYNSVMIPEEIPTNEKTAFAGAAAAAHKAGKKNFEFQGKMYPVTMQKDTAHAIASEETIHEGELPDLPKKKSMTSKDYSALANKHSDLASDHRKQADRHAGVNDSASERHKEAADAHDEAASAAKAASDDLDSHTTSQYTKKARGANYASGVARERGAEADKRRANVRKVDGKDESVSEAAFAPCDGCPDPDKCGEAGKCMKAEEAVDVDAGNVEKALKHDCATHVHHEEHGVGRCIPGMHTLEQVDEENGVVTHYDVMFENDEGSYIVENVPVAEMKVLKDMNHGHKKKKSTDEGYAGNYGSSVSSYNREKDHEKRYEKENPGKRWKDLSWGHQQSHSANYDKNPK